MLLCPVEPWSSQSPQVLGPWGGAPIEFHGMFGIVFPLPEAFREVPSNILGLEGKQAHGACFVVTGPC
jgi:hypothetical protein